MVQKDSDDLEQVNKEMMKLEVLNLAQQLNALTAEEMKTLIKHLDQETINTLRDKLPPKSRIIKNHFRVESDHSKPNK